MTKLNDLQLILLSTASQRDNGSLIPLPESIATDTARASKAITTLIRKGLAEETPVSDRRLTWRDADKEPTGVFITAAGREAIGTDEAGEDGEAGTAVTGDPADATAAAKSNASDAAAASSSSAPATPRTGSKIELVLSLLHRPEGATLTELIEATGWLPHTTRAALTGLRKKGHEVARSKRGDATCYSIVSGAAAEAPDAGHEQAGADGAAALDVAATPDFPVPAEAQA